MQDSEQCVVDIAVDIVLIIIAIVAFTVTIDAIMITQASDSTPVVVAVAIVCKPFASAIVSIGL